RTTSPIPSGSVLPSSRDKSRPSSSLRARMVLPTVSSRFARSCTDDIDQAGNAARAAAIALSACVLSARAYSPMTSLKSEGLTFLALSAPAIQSPPMKLRCISLIIILSSVRAQKIAGSQVTHQLAGAKSPGRRSVARGHTIFERTKACGADHDPVVRLVRESHARCAAIVDRREHRAEKQHESI